MSSLAAIFGGSAAKSRDSEKLLNLYWNRAELKKEFSRMRKEQFKLQDRIKQQEGAGARLQQKLDHLESLLLDPAWADNVLVFYQLRALSLRCERKLGNLAEQLKQQREQRQHNALLLRWNNERAEEAKTVEGEVDANRQLIRELDAELECERDRLMAMSGLLRFFRKRSITSRLDDLSAKRNEATRDQEALLARVHEIRHRPPPDHPGLDINSKRSINFMILSYTQQLYLHFRDGDMAACAREASEKSVGAINYGDRQSCIHFMERIRRRIGSLESAEDSPAILQKRARLISEQAHFRAESDTVPIAGTVTTIFDIGKDGSVRKSNANLLGENYWGVARVLCR